jgi:RNA ligase
MASVADPQNFEGFVLRFPSTNQRVKVKLDEYVRLHRVLTSCSSKTIWELLSSGQGLGDVLERVPDEFMRWVNLQSSSLLRQYREIEEECREQCARLTVPGDRKATALRFTEQKYPGVLFKMLDGKDHSQSIWKLLKPEFERPFVVQHETAS